MYFQRFKKAGAVITIISILASMYSIPAYAAAYIQDWNLVDTGKHLDYDVDSKYESAIEAAVPIWNNYKKGVIRKDSLTNIEDVSIIDMYRVNNQAATTSLGGSIRLNTYILDQESFNKNIVNTVAHEFGHALGLEHHSTSTLDIMYTEQTSTKTLSKNDKDSYDAAYERYDLF